MKARNLTTVAATVAFAGLGHRCGQSDVSSPRHCDAISRRMRSSRIESFTLRRMSSI
jgi:hypothetical protein